MAHAQTAEMHRDLKLISFLQCMKSTKIAKLTGVSSGTSSASSVAVVLVYYLSNMAAICGSTSSGSSTPCQDIKCITKNLFDRMKRNATTEQITNEGAQNSLRPIKVIYRPIKPTNVSLLLFLYTLLMSKKYRMLGSRERKQHFMLL